MPVIVVNSKNCVVELDPFSLSIYGCNTSILHVRLTVTVRTATRAKEPLYPHNKVHYSTESDTFYHHYSISHKILPGGHIRSYDRITKGLLLTQSSDLSSILFPSAVVWQPFEIIYYWILFLWSGVKIINIRFEECLMEDNIDPMRNSSLR